MFQPTLELQFHDNVSKNGRCSLCKQFKKVKCIDKEEGTIACSKCFGTNVWHSQKQGNKDRDNVDYLYETMTLGVRRNVK